MGAVRPARVDTPQECMQTSTQSHETYWREIKTAIEVDVRTVMRRHPRAGQWLRRDSEAIHDVTQAYLIHLLENPATLEAKARNTRALLRTDIWRFVDLLLRKSGQPAGIRLQNHLYSKVRDALRKDSHFRQSELKQWYLTTARAGVTSPQPEDREVIWQLPWLPSDFDRQRDGQLPPVVASEDLPPFLERCLEVAAMPCYATRLANLAWAKLKPMPLMTLVQDGDVDTDANIDDDIDPDSHNFPDQARLVLGREVDLHVSRLIGALTDEQRQAVALRFLDGLGSRDIAKRVGKSKSWVSNQIEQFTRELTALAGRLGLMDGNGPQTLFGAALDNLSS
jgi:hypothetical protein